MTYIVDFIIEVSNALQQDLLLKVSALETESKENTERLQAEILKKSEEIDTSQKERIKLEKHADSLDQELIQLRNALEEKEQCVLHCKEQEKKLQDQITEVLEQTYSANCMFLTGFCVLFMFIL